LITRYSFITSTPTTENNVGGGICERSELTPPPPFTLNL
jgi:hypothetical protein